MGPRVPFAPALLTLSLHITLYIYFISSRLFILLYVTCVMVNKAVKKLADNCDDIHLMYGPEGKLVINAIYMLFICIHIFPILLFYICIYLYLILFARIFCF